GFFMGAFILARDILLMSLSSTVSPQHNAQESSRLCLRQPYSADRFARHCAVGKGATNSHLSGRKVLCTSSQATAPAMPVTTTFLGELQQLVSLHGYWVIGLIVGLESLGLPLPGETILVLAAIYAASEPSFNIWVVIAVAVFGAIIGDNIGYWLGSRYGCALLLRSISAGFQP